MRRNLLALSSAAVLAVYTAGYERTKEAAERFANETEHRKRPPLPITTEAAPATFAPVANKTPTPAPTKSKPKASGEIERERAISAGD